MPRRVLVVVNPISGRGRGLRSAERFAAAFRAAGGAVEQVATSGPGEAQRAAAFAGHGGYDAVVAVGGDGTVNEVLNGIEGTGLPVGIVPIGTANVLARDLGVHLGPEAAARVVATGRARTLDVGVARNGAGETRRFLCCAGAGFDGAVVAAVAEGRGRRLGFRGWIGPIRRAFASYSFPPLRVAVNGEAAGPATMAVVCNTANYAGFLSLVPGADPGDGELDACLMDVRRRRTLFRYAWAAWRGRLPAEIGVATRRGRTVRIESDEAVPVQVDGDPFGTTPLRIEVRPGAAHVLVPAEEVP